MRKLAIILFAMTIVLLLMSACESSNSDVDNTYVNNFSIIDNAFSDLLNCDNYKSEWYYERTLLTEGEMKEYDSNGSTLIFHNPYRSYMFSSGDPSQNNGIVSGEFYELKEGDNYKHKTIYKLESGDTKEDEFDGYYNEEWLVTQIKSCLSSSGFVGEQTIDGIKVKKYRISVTAYPFIIEFGFSKDKHDFKTRIFMDEYKACAGYIYINSETGFIQKIDFDLSEKMALNRKIIARIFELGDRGFTMPEYGKLKISIVISNINDDSKDIADIEKEINRVMGR